MDSRYQINKAKSEDINDLVAMRLSLQKHLDSRNQNLWELSPERLSEYPEIYRKMMSNKDVSILVIYDTEKEINVGMGIGTLITHNEFKPNSSGRIDDIWIDPDHRRKGLCKRLILELAKFFRENGIMAVSLQYVMGNTEAEHVWPRLGFDSVIKIANANLEDIFEKCDEIKHNHIFHRTLN